MRGKEGWGRQLLAYLEVLKPRETTLLTFIGLVSGLIAAGGRPDLLRLFLATLAVALGSAGCLGLTNYLDREIDARMERTRRRALPSRRIEPAERVLPLAGALSLAGLGLALYLNPLAFLCGLIGTFLALVGRKSEFTHFLGALSSCAPVLVGWLALGGALNTVLLALGLLVVVWVPLHVWSLMASQRLDYLQAGVCLFPLRLSQRSTAKLLFGVSCLLLIASLFIYWTGGFGWLYLGAALLLGLVVLRASARLMRGDLSQGAWRVYKLSAYPYLGLLFLAMALDRWV